LETNEQNTKEELKEEKIVADETPQEEVTEETTTELSNEEKLQQEVERLNDQVYRLSAEISNIQKRNAKERQDAAKYRSQSLAQNLLNVIDNLERAIASPSESEDAQNLKKGIEMVYESFLYALTDKVVQVFQKGYKLKDRVLRPAMVIVSQ